MDFEFRRNMFDDGVVALFSMEHQIIGRWFSEELSTDKVKLNEIKFAMTSLEKNTIHDWRLVGRESTIEITKDQVTIFENTLSEDDESIEGLEQGFSVYSAESLAYCGFEDFKNALESFEAFIR